MLNILALVAFLIGTFLATFCVAKPLVDIYRDWRNAASFFRHMFKTDGLFMVAFVVGGLMALMFAASAVSMWTKSWPSIDASLLLYAVMIVLGVCVISRINNTDTV